MYPLFVGFPSRLSLHRALSRAACAVRHVLVSRLFHTQYRQERLRAGSEGDDRGWDGWMASPTRWTWVWASSGSGWWTGRPGVLWFVGLPRVGHNWTTELIYMCVCIYMVFFWVFSIVGYYKILCGSYTIDLWIIVGFCFQGWGHSAMQQEISHM